MRRRLLGLFALIVVLLLVGLLFQYTPQKSQDVRPAPSSEVVEVGVPQWFNQPDMVAASLMPMANPVKCFRKYTQRSNRWSSGPYDDSFKSEDTVWHRWCHNRRGRDWTKAYRFGATILYQRNRCKFENNRSPSTRMRGFRVRAYFKDKYRNSSSPYSRGLWMPCSSKGFSTESRYIGRSSRRQYNVKNWTPWTIMKKTVVYTVINDAVGKKRLPQLPRNSDSVPSWGNNGGGVPV